MILIHILFQHTNTVKLKLFRILQIKIFIKKQSAVNNTADCFIDISYFKISNLGRNYYLSLRYRNHRHSLPTKGFSWNPRSVLGLLF